MSLIRKITGLKMTTVFFSLRWMTKGDGVQIFAMRFTLINLICLISEQKLVMRKKNNEVEKKF